jgi:hypothetical protein
LIYEKKNNPVYFADRMDREMRGMSLKDSDLLIDLRLGSQKDIENLFESNRRNMLLSHEARHAEQLAAEDGRSTRAGDRMEGRANALRQPTPDGPYMGTMGDAMQSYDERGRVTAAALTQHGCGHVADPTAAIQSGRVKNKADLFESLPLFLSHQYRGMYDKAVDKADNWQQHTRDGSSSPSPTSKG